MKKIFKISYFSAIGLIVAIAALLIISVLPITGNIKILAVLSGSMEPAIHTGSVVIIKQEANYRIGDIITFGKTGKDQAPVTHRIYDIRVQEGQPIYVTKGDANNAPDAKETPQSEVQGKALFSVPLAGYAINFAKQPLGFLLIILIPAAIIIFDEAKKIYAEIKKKKKEAAAD